MENQKTKVATWNKHSITFSDHLLKFNYISKAKHREIQKRVKEIVKANDGEAAYDFSSEVFHLYLRLTEQRDLKHKIYKKIDARCANRDAALKNKADRLAVLCKEAYLSGLVSQQDFNYINYHLFANRGNSGLSDDQCHTFTTIYYSALQTHNPRYKTIQAAESRIRELLVSLEHYKPILP